LSRRAEAKGKELTETARRNLFRLISRQYSLVSLNIRIV
jgi:hypothetical protein